MEEREFPSRPRWSTPTKFTVSLMVIALWVYLLFRFSVVLPPFILAVILAYVLSPLVNRVQRHLRLPRSMAILIAYLLVLGILALLGWLIVPPVIEQMSGLGGDIQRLVRGLEIFLSRRLVIAGWQFNPEALIEPLRQALQTLIEQVMANTVNIVTEVLSSFVWIIFIAVVTFYLIKDSQNLNHWFEGLVPPLYREDYRILREEINRIWSSFFRGQLALAGVVALIFSVVSLALGLPFPLAMAIFAGVMEFLPSLGHGIWLFVASVLAFFVGSTWLPLPNWIFMLLVIGLHLIFEQFDLNYLIPRIIGRSVHLPPLVVILGIVGGALIAGVLGIFLAAPTIASLRVIGRYIYANLLDLDPFPIITSSPLPPPNPRWWQREEKEPQFSNFSERGEEQ
ncbi:MAG: AI-2E family transporter [Anaerolineales bacterium]